MHPPRRDLSRLDYSPLTEPVDPVALRRFRAARIDPVRGWKSLSASMSKIVETAVGLVVVVFATIFGGGLFLNVLGAVLASAGIPRDESAPLRIVALVLLILSVVAVLLLRRHRTMAEEWRLDAFARANGFEFAAASDPPERPGLIFGAGRSRRIDRAIRGETSRFLELANYRYTTGSGKNRTVHRWGYAAVRIGSPLPHIVLDTVGNNGLFGSSNLPASFDRSQRLRLEGDFDEHFELYCPAGYERDALYLFTPDIMVDFIDHAARFDVEIVDDWLFLYARGREFVTVDPTALADVFSIVDAVTTRLEQWERWRDERLEAVPGAEPTPPTGSEASQDPGLGVSRAPEPVVDPHREPEPTSTAHQAAARSSLRAGAFPVRPRGVAAEGRRLRRGASWTGWVGLAIAAYWVWTWLR